MKLNTKLLLLVVMFVTLTGAASAASTYTQTIVHFSVPTVIGFTVTLLSQSGVTSNANPVSAPTADIYFNASNSGTGFQNCTVVGGGVQTGSSPCMTIQNTGTVKINFSMVLNDTLPSCIKVYYNTTSQSYAGAIVSQAVTNSAFTVKADTNPLDPANNVYLYANFSNCLSNATVDRLLYVNGSSA